MKLYGLKNCDTCRKALKSLPHAELVDVRVQGVPDAILTQAAGEFGTRLMNTRSTTWRGLDEAQRAWPMLELLAEHPALMKRPLIEAGGTLYLEWDAGVQAALLPA
jgi:arsenate reductase